MKKWKKGLRREEERGGGGKVGGAHRDLDHTYPELSVARATLVKVSLLLLQKYCSIKHG